MLDGGQQQRAALKRCWRFRVGIATEFDSQNERGVRQTCLSLGQLKCSAQIVLKSVFFLCVCVLHT